MAPLLSRDPRPLLYLDTSALKRPFDPPGAAGDRIEQEQRALAAINSAIADGRLRLLSSSWLGRENQADPDVIRAAAAARILHQAWACTLDTATVNALAARLVALGVHPADALHVATAEIGGADYFVSTDDRLCRRLSRLTVATVFTFTPTDPVTLVKELEF